jgi:hypothetical protein
MLQALIVEGNGLKRQYGRFPVTDVLLLVTCTLLPEQIVQSR